jgi:hypothetical protein
LPLDLGALRLQRRHQPDVMKDAGVQAMREQAKTFGDAGSPSLKVAERRPDCANFHLAGSLPQVTDVHADGGDILAHAVVQLARDARALGFLRGNQPPGKVADPIVTAAEIRFSGLRDAFGLAPARALRQKAADQNRPDRKECHARDDVPLILPGPTCWSSFPLSRAEGIGQLPPDRRYRGTDTAVAHRDVGVLADGG